MKTNSFNEKESLEIITKMINRTKNRLHIGDGNMLLLWGYLTIGITALVWVLFSAFHNPIVMWLFFLIWIIGAIASRHITSKKQAEEGCSTTYVDTVSKSVWNIVGYSTLILTLSCLSLHYLGYYNCWAAMYVIPFLMVGTAESIQGTIIREKSLKFGGLIGMIIGCAILAMICGGVRFNVNCFFTILIASFTAMMIIPGHLLNFKARQVCYAN